MFEPEKIASALVEAAAQISIRTEPAAKADGNLTRILASADQYLAVADEALAAGEIQTALIAIAAAVAACKLVDRLITDPHDEAALVFAAPWAREEVGVAA